VRARLLIMLLLLAPNAARAACIPSLSVNASTLSFGTYDPGAATSPRSTGAVTVQCLVGLLPSFTVALSAGGSNDFTMRTMSNGSNRLAYNLYVDSNRMMIWGDGTGGTSTQSFSGLLSLLSTSFTVYGRAPKSQYAAPGSYTDTITVTVTY
jgi:spore coat protein U-like protein